MNKINKKVSLTSIIAAEDKFQNSWNNELIYFSQRDSYPPTS